MPAGLPSQLLERRPDIAAAERRVAAANAEVGVATSAYYPILELTGAAGIRKRLAHEARERREHVLERRAATLRHGVRCRTAARGGRASARGLRRERCDVSGDSAWRFREVEDQLAALRILDEEATIQRRAVDAAERSLQQATNRYRGGLASYLEVTFAQSVALSNERTAVDLLTRRMTASVLLIKGLGGGWDVRTLPAVSR